MTRLSVEGLDVSLAGRPVLRKVSFAVGPGEFIGLIGPNGAGKSTLLRAIAGLLPYEGAIALDGEDGRALSASARARKMGYLAQERDIAWPLPVETLVALGRAPYLSRFAPLGPDDRTAVETALRRMDVVSLRARPATELSGGELARVLIARVLAQETPAILADEPIAGLDPAHQIGVMRLFRQLAQEGRSVIASMHDLGLAARWCTRLILLHGGRVAIDASPDVALSGTALQAAFGVTLHAAKPDGRWLVQPLDIIGDEDEGPSQE
ncbi:MAG: ABC transporter ATP-binding protein [Rhizobiales bacterium]|nr:ABC transporter ATP-binding protein [Hyphomicrobiales bacterium]